MGPGAATQPERSVDLRDAGLAGISSHIGVPG